MPAGFRAFPGKTTLADFTRANLTPAIATVLKIQMTQLLPKVQKHQLIGFSPDAGDMAHDGILREFGHEFLLG